MSYRQVNRRYDQGCGLPPFQQVCGNSNLFQAAMATRIMVLLPVAAYQRCDGIGTTRGISDWIFKVTLFDARWRRVFRTVSRSDNSASLKEDSNYYSFFYWTLCRRICFLYYRRRNCPVN
ncbi:Uncharacterised protein at_DN0630 [Pycnogonum litorale]